MPAALISLTSCTRYATVKTLDELSLLMSKQEVLVKMPNGEARGAIVNKYNQTIEVREYQLPKSLATEIIMGFLECANAGFNAGSGSTSKPYKASSKPGFDIQTYWLYFCDGKLVQWGRAGDCEEAQRVIYDVNFNLDVES